MAWWPAFLRCSSCSRVLLPPLLCFVRFPFAAPLLACLSRGCSLASASPPPLLRTGAACRYTRAVGRPASPLLCGFPAAPPLLRVFSPAPLSSPAAQYRRDSFSLASPFFPLGDSRHLFSPPPSSVLADTLACSLASAWLRSSRPRCVLPSPVLHSSSPRLSALPSSSRPSFPLARSSSPSPWPAALSPLSPLSLLSPLSPLSSFFSRSGALSSLSRSSVATAELAPPAMASSSLGRWLRRAFSSSVLPPPLTSPDGRPPARTAASAASMPPTSSPSPVGCDSPRLSPTAGVPRNSRACHAAGGTSGRRAASAAIRRDATLQSGGGSGGESQGEREPATGQATQTRGKSAKAQKRERETRLLREEPTRTPTPEAVTVVHSHVPLSESTSASSPLSPSLSPSSQFGDKSLFCQLDASRSWLDVRKLKRDVESRMQSRRAEERSEDARWRDHAEEAEVPQWRRAQDGETEDASARRRKAGLEDAQLERQNARGTDSEWTMRVMTFNVLAESLTDYKYRSLDQNIVKWTSRVNVIESEIRRHRPAICCLQELDATHYRKRFLPFFRSLGYEGVYKQKTQGREDGVGTFWLRDRFELVEQRGIEFRQHSKSLIDKPQVGLVVLLRERAAEPASEPPCALPRSHSAPAEVSACPHPSARSCLPPRKPAVSRHCSTPHAAPPAPPKPSSKRRREAAAALSSSLPSNSSGPCADRADSCPGARLVQSVPRMVVAANTHLLFNSRRGDVKLAQLLLLLQAVYELRRRGLGLVRAELRQARQAGTKRQFRSELRASRAAPDSDGRAVCQQTEACVGFQETARGPLSAGERTGRSGPHSSSMESGGRSEQVEDADLSHAETLLDVLLCGDFNFTPQSPLYQLVLRGSFDFSGLDHRKLSGQFLMERHAYRMEAAGYQGRGATVVSSPREAQVMTSLDPGLSVSASQASAHFHHSHSVPGGMAEPGEASGCVRTQAKAGASCVAHAGASTSSQWMQDLYKVLENTPVFDTFQTPGLSRTASSPGGAKAEGLKHWKPELRSSAVITLPLRFNSAYALPTLGSESDETRRKTGENNKRQRPRPKTRLKWSWRNRPSPLITDGKRAASITFSTIQSRSTWRASTNCPLWQTPSHTVAVQTK
ncbi:UNVERIFIED_CONTAM: endonuclease/exonuclease/phosphatase family protein [Hammondia hammondi]|eukprot:XP_008887407.1 endonuclease/exonuclease/phosphatase family protein [Hammondia hammondi]